MAAFLRNTAGKGYLLSRVPRHRGRGRLPPRSSYERYAVWSGDQFPDQVLITTAPTGRFPTLLQTPSWSVTGWGFDRVMHCANDFQPRMTATSAALAPSKRRSGGSSRLHLRIRPLFPSQAPITNGLQDWSQGVPFVGEPVGAPLATILRGHLLDDPVLQQPLKSLAEDVGGNALGRGCKVFEPSAAKNEIANHKQGPPVSKDVQRTGNRTGRTASGNRGLFQGGAALFRDHKRIMSHDSLAFHK